MVLVLSEVQKSRSIGQSLYADVYGKSAPVLVTSTSSTIEFLAVSLATDLVLVDSLLVDDPVVCLNKFCHPNLETDCLLVLTEAFVLLFVCYDVHLAKFVVIHSITFDACNQQLPSDSSPLIVVDPSPFPQFFTVFFFEGFIQMFVINHEWRPAPDGTVTPNRLKRKRLRDDLVEDYTFAIGAVTTQDIKVLKNRANGGNALVAILYRDYNFNYSMRYYAFDLPGKKLVLVKQFEEFEEPPTTMISPNCGGVLILTDNYAFYFPNDDIKYLEVSENNSDENLICKTGAMMITKKLKLVKQAENLTSFYCSTVIDDKRILMINNKGETFLLFFDFEQKSNASLRINALSFINLGITTIPTAVHHINGNLFYVTSKLSQSVLFKIRPSSPYIEIFRFFPSTPPILDIKLQYNGLTYDLFSSQGGYESGEFRKLSSKSHYLQFQKSFKSGILSISEASQFLLADDNNEMAVVRLTDTSNKQVQFYGIGEDGSHQELDIQSYSESLVLKSQNKTYLDIRQNGVFINGESINGIHIVKAKALSTSEFILLDMDNKVYIYSEVLLQTISLDKSAQVSDMDVVNVFGQEYLVLLSFWDGSCLLYLISTDEYELIFNDVITTGEVPITSSVLMYKTNIDPAAVWMIFITSNNNLIELFVNFRKSKVDNNKTKISNFNGLPFKISKNLLNDIILFNKKEIYAITNDKMLDYNRVFKLDANVPNLDINYVTYLGANTLIVCVNDNDILIYKIKPINKSINEVVFSNDLICKSLIIKRYGILLGSTNVFNESTNEYVKNSFLLLIDLRKMKQVSKLSFPNEAPIEITDITQMSTEGMSLEFGGGESSSYIVAVCNSQDSNNLFKVFEIKKNAIQEVSPHCIVTGIINPSNLEPQSIRLLDAESNSYIVSGAMNFIAKPRSLREWTVVPESVYPASTTCISTAVNKEHVVFADVMNGLTFMSINTGDKDNYNSVPTLERSTTSQYLMSTFVTDVLLLEDTSSSTTTVLAGDSLGNILGLLEENDKESDYNHSEENTNEFLQVISYNIGDSINVMLKLCKPAVKVDFPSYFDKLDQPEKNLEPQVLIGTVNGSIYTLSTLNDVDEEIQDIIEDCTKELVLYRTTLSDIQSSNKRDKYSRWRIRRDAKMFQQDEVGEPVRKEQNGVVDLTLIQQWVARDSLLRRNENRSLEADQEIDDMETCLKTCYTHKSLLQKLVFEVQFV